MTLFLIKFVQIILLQDFLPNPGSAILASNFPSVTALADHLHSLNTDDEKYVRLHLKHKKNHNSGGSGSGDHLVANKWLKNMLKRR